MKMFGRKKKGTTVTMVLPEGIVLTPTQVAYVQSAAQDALGIVHMTYPDGTLHNFVTRGPGVTLKAASLEWVYSEQRPKRFADRFGPGETPGRP